MHHEMLINVSEGEECRIALVEDGKLEELYMERTSSTSHVGNIYKGRVTNVEASIQAAFIDFGLGRNGFLHISDLMPTYFGRRGEDVQESVGRKLARRDRPPIQKCLRRGDEIIVQIIKEGIGTKGPTLSTYVSIPGRILVMMPGMAKNGVSRKIEDEGERRRLRQILDALKPSRDCGFIIRTNGVGKTKAEIERDLKYLTRLWETIKKKRDTRDAPIELYAEGDLVTRTVRDVFSNDIERIIVDNESIAHKVQEFFKIASPRTKTTIDLHTDPVPLFHKYGIEAEIEQMYSRHVPLPSGGSLVIDSTEAVVAIDVNSGRFRDHSDAETTAFKTDMEAADEIPRQLRLRDLGGVIICDFIDLRYERHRKELEKRLQDNLNGDRAKTKMLRMSQFGIIEMTRQRMRPSLKRSIYFDCPHCKGAGLVKTPESMGLDVMRRLAIAINDQRVQRIEMSVCPEVAFVLANRKRQAVTELEGRYHKKIIIQSDGRLGMDEIKLELFDARDGLVYLEELGMFPQMPPAAGGRPQGQHGRRDHRDDRRREDRHRQPQGRPQERPVEGDVDQDDRFEMDRAEDALEEREEELFDNGEQAAAPSLPKPPAAQPAPAVTQPRPPATPPRPAQAAPPAVQRQQPQQMQRPPAPQGGAQPQPAMARGPQGQGHPQEQGQGEGGGRRRRRRRRGRRGGRGRGQGEQFMGQGGQGAPPQFGEGAPADERHFDEADAIGGEREADFEDRRPQPVSSRDEFADRDDFDDRGESAQRAPQPAEEAHPQTGPAREQPRPAPIIPAPPRQAPPVAARAAGPQAPVTPPPAPPVQRPVPAPIVAAAAPVQEPAEAEAKPKRGRRRPAAKPAAKAAAGAAKPAASRRRKSSGRTKAKSEPVVEAAEPVAAAPARLPPRPASADRHLVQDEPVNPQPIHRPRTYRDLDHIPDDLD